MSKLFYRDFLTQQTKTYGEFVSELKETTTYNPYCLQDNNYAIFRTLVLSLLYGREIVLLDSDFSSSEVTKLIGSIERSHFDTPLDPCSLRDLTEYNLVDFLTKHSHQWSLTIFTSGTTGLPKSVKHTFASLTRFVKQSAGRHSDIWGFAYNPTHMAGLQVFFQALLNGNSLVRLFRLSKEDIFAEISQYQVSHLSATPTFYRMLFPCPATAIPSVLRITSGGEKFDQATVSRLQHIFIHAKVTNVYASTEAGTLFASTGNEFELKDQFLNLVKVVDHELMLHKSLLGQSEITLQSGDWYATGDLVEVLALSPLKFRFSSRKNEMINVGGYKVNPVEVEEAIEQLPSIQQCRVYAKSNAILGHMIYCDVVVLDPAITEQYIRLQLAGKLQEYKIPRIIRICDSIEQTRSGKIKR